MYADRYSNQELAKEFMENAKHLKNSRGRVYLYHEVLSLEANKLELQKAQAILLDLANAYIHARAKNQLVFGAVHSDTKNLHMHLAISSNEIGSNKRTRLSKKDFADLQTQLETYKNQKHKELGQSHLYERKQGKSKSKRAEQEMKHKREQKPSKEKIREELEAIFSKATTREYLNNSLKNKGYELYTRGTTKGVTFEGKKYRLGTLSLESQYQQSLKKIETREKLQAKRQDYKQSKSQAKSQSKEQSFSRWKKRHTLKQGTKNARRELL